MRCIAEDAEHIMVDKLKIRHGEKESERSAEKDREPGEFVAAMLSSKKNWSCDFLRNRKITERVLEGITSV